MDAADLKADRPDLTCEEAALVARTHSGALVSVEELPSDRDRNFRLTARDGERSVLKVAALAETREVLALENLVMARAHAAGVPVPLVLPDVDGELLRAVTLSDGRTHWVRRISWLPGRPLAEVRPKSAEVLGELGALLGHLDLELAQIADPAVQRELFWDLRSAARSFDPAQAVMANAERRGLFERWRERLAPTLVLLDELPRQLIQNDANDYNVLVEESLDGQRISGLLDFGDCVWTARAAEPAIAMAYAMLDAPDPVGCGLALAGGYCSAFPLEDRELELLFELAALRLMHSVANSALRMAEEPDDAYLTISEAPAWRLLERMLEVPQAEGAARLRLAAGLELGGPSLPANALAGWLPLGEVHPLDLSLTSPALARAGGEAGLLAAARARGTAVLRFGEISEVDAPLVAGPDGPLPATRRLGVGLTLPAGTLIALPWAGEVERKGDRALLRSAGNPTLLVTGVKAGEGLGRVGDGPVHVQLVADDVGHGLGLPTRAVPGDPLWEALVLDPVEALGLPEFCTAAAPAVPEERHRGRALSLSYEHPLAIVAGRGTRLIDASGRSFLDAVNNVPHVGHAHPRVVRALADQAAVLNTNTRYLHPVRDAYLARLAGLFADPLELVYLVNSGSEANELALRLVEAATGGEHWIVVEAGYHGNTRRLVERSHYKFAGAGGFEPPANVHVVPLPDTYRGLYRGADAAERYAAHVAEACERIASSGGKLAGFLAEPLIGCGGQVVPPAGWLRRCYDHVHAAGGLCIADEVQVGFGRVGTHWWAFDEQGATPDLVTLGKPIGNGHPLGAVVTRNEISEAFDGGMEWFNTFGGNPVSCAVGMAVLDVIEEEGLRERATRVGALLVEGLRDLATEHALIGEVRGRGTYLGAELVLDPVTREPAGAHAYRVADRMKAKGVLISTDGPHHNVLKIKPPIVFDESDAAQLLEALSKVLDETAFEA